MRKKYGQSTKVLLTKGRLVVIEVDRKLLLKFKTKDEKDKYVADLEF